jgi:hypothetical protein
MVFILSAVLILPEFPYSVNDSEATLRNCLYVYIISCVKCKAAVMTYVPNLLCFYFSCAQL